MAATTPARHRVFPTATGQSRSELTHVVSSANTAETQDTLNTNSFADFVQRRAIKKRCCNKFLLSPKNEPTPTCQCGLLKTEHTDEALSYVPRNPNEKWVTSSHTKTEPTDAFGEIEFSAMKTSKYIRVDYKTDVATIVHMMLNHWHVDRPNLLISVTGGAVNFTMTPRLTEVFRNGFIKAATSTGAWIITGGTNAGVMKHVGEAVRDYMIKHGAMSRVVALGIAPWGCISNRKSLQDDHDPPVGRWPVHYQMIEDGDGRRTTPVDPNHTHFIFVDNGTHYKFGTEIKLRAELESYVSKKGLNLGGADTVTIPVICVVLEGGPNTLETVKSAVENGTPAIIVGGSGRAADILAYAYTNTAEETVEVEDKSGKKHKRTVAIDSEEVWTNVRNKLIETFCLNDDAAIATCLFNIQECIKRRDHLTVFQVTAGVDASDVDVTLLRALLKVSNKRIDQLKLALAWNRVDIAKDEIFTPDAEFEMSELYDMMYMAITKDRVDFVRLFIQNGVNLRDFLTVPRLLSLYNDKVTEEGTAGIHLAKKKEKKEEKVSFKHVGSVLKDLIGEFFDPKHSHEPYASVRLEDYTKTASPSRRTPRQAPLNAPSKRLPATPGNNETPAGSSPIPPLKSGVVNKLSSWITQSQMKRQQKDVMERFKTFDDAAIELFLWSVLMGRKELSVCFWEEGMEGVSAALTAQLILGGLIKKAKGDVITAILEEQASFYEQLAVGVLSECYSSNPKMTMQLLVREVPTFGNTTAMQLAVEAKNMEFVAHPASQAVLSKIWMGQLVEDNNSLAIMFCLLVPPMAGLILKYDEPHTSAFLSRDPIYRRDSSSSTKMLVPQSEALGRAGGQLRASRRGSVYKLKPDKKKLERTDTIQSMQRVSQESTSSNPCKAYFHRLRDFFNAPVVVFAYHSLAYFAFLLLYGVILLTDFRPTIDKKEIILIVWVGTLFCEEIRQLAMESSGSVFLRLYSYVTDPWNVLDMVSFLTYAAGLILRFIPVSICSTCFYASRIILAINYMFFFFHLFIVFAVHPTLGPKLVIIARMMIDLLYFVLILLVFIAAYGVASQVILYPNSPLNIRLARDVLSNAWWNVFGQLNIDEVSGNSCNAAGVNKTYDAFTCAANGYDTSLCLSKDEMCPSIDWLMPIIMAIYALITNVLMLNLLIAIFNDTFSKVEASTNLVWKTQRYFLVTEFDSKPILMPPLIVFSHIYLVFRTLFRCCGRCYQEAHKFGFGMSLNDFEKKNLIVWENVNALEYLRKATAQTSDTVENLVMATSARVEVIAQKVDQIAESPLLMQSAETFNNFLRQESVAKLPPQLEERIWYLEEQMRRTSKALDFLVETIAHKARKPPPDLRDIDSELEKARREKEDEVKQKRAEVLRKLKLQLELHSFCRTSKYPTRRGHVSRFDVPDDLVPFEVPYEEYQPEEYSEDVSETDGIAFEAGNVDIDLLKADPRPVLAFNSIDTHMNVNRRSYIGHYEVIDGVPQNPKGRTGLRGRGVLPRWGPNHVGVAIITRWRQTPGNSRMAQAPKRALECVATSREDSGNWGFPEMLYPTKDCRINEVNEMVMKIFRSQDKELIEQLCCSGVQFYEGYVDDHRNTDNAWIEALIFSYHDDDGKMLNNAELQTIDYRWQKLTSNSSPLYTAHRALAESLNAKLLASDAARGSAT